MRKKKKWRRFLAGVLAVSVASSNMFSTQIVKAAEVKAESNTLDLLEQLKNTEYGKYVSTIKTPQNSPVINPNYDRSYDNYEVRSKEGLLHPGILLNREELNIMRDMVWLGAEPWTSAFNELQKSPYAQLDYKMSGPFETISSDRETYSLTRASTAAYELSLMWYITGKKEYADKAKEIILAWAEGVKTDAKYDHLRMGTSTHKLCIAAEIMRYTPSSGWTKEDTDTFNKYLDLVDYAINKPYEYLNQGGYALIAYMAKTIFQDDFNGYAQAVEREAYNVNGGWKNGNSINFSLSSMVFNDGSFIEMGRDQWHAYDNMGTHSSVIKTSYVQGTKVDEKGNIVSTGGKDLYEFGNQKLLKMAATLARYNYGEEVNFIPNKNAWGEKTEFSENSSVGRGMDFWEPSIYNHYRYIKGYQPEDKRTIENATQGPDTTVDPYITYEDIYQQITNGKETNLGKEPNVDFPDYKDLTFTPLMAIEEVPLKGAPQEAVKSNDNCKAYNRYMGDQFTGTGNDERSVDNDGRNGGAVTEPCTDEEGNSHFMTSDVNNGEWIAYSIDFDQTFGSTKENPVDTLILSYGTNSSGGDIDVYIGDYKEEPTVEDYKTARENQIGTIHIEDTQGYTNFTLADQKFSKKKDQFTGKKTIYFYYYNSKNVYKFHGNTFYFKFVCSRSIDKNNAKTNGFVKLNNVEVQESNSILSNHSSIGFQNMDFDNGYTTVELSLKNTIEKGTLKLYQGKLGEGSLIQTMDISGKQGIVSFPKEEKNLVGRNDIYLEYEGNQKLEIENVSFTKIATSRSSYSNIETGNYLKVLKGDVKKTEKNGIIADLSKDTYLSYNAVPFLTGPSRIGIRVKTNAACTLQVDQLNTGNALETGNIGRDGNRAMIEIPDTSKLSNDGWITMQCKIKQEGAGANTGNNPIGLGINGTGNGQIEIEYFRFDPEENMPQLKLSNNGTEYTTESEIILSEKTEQKYQIVSDNNNIQIYETLPQGFTFNTGSNTLTVNANAGEYDIKILANKGTSLAIQTFHFIVQGNQQQVEQVIKEADIEDSLLSLYVYNNKIYQEYKKAVETANQNPNEQNLTALKTVIQTCKENIPVYTKVKFAYRAQKENDIKEDEFKNHTIRLYTETEEKENCRQEVKTGTLLADTGRLPEKDTEGNSWTSPLHETEWIPFHQKMDGLHSLTVQTDHWSTRLSYFELSNEDETAIKKIDGVSYTECSHHGNVSVERPRDAEENDIAVYGGTKAWVKYTLDYYDLSNYIYEPKVAGPFHGKTGTGINFTIVPEVKTALKETKTFYEEIDKYTMQTAQAFQKAYENAQDAVENYEKLNLTTEKSKELAEALRLAAKNLVVADTQVSVELEEGSNLILDPSGNNDGNLKGANLSKNPTVTGIAGKNINFNLKMPENAVCELVHFGFRGCTGTDENALKEVDPELSDKPVITRTAKKGIYNIAWKQDRPGNYRAVFEITMGQEKIEKVVEIVLRNETVREDLYPKYARIRVSTFHGNPEDKNMILSFIPEGKGENDPEVKKIEFGTLERTGGKYILSSWVELPEDLDMSQTYTLKLQAFDTYIWLDFIEFATESYHTLYPSDSNDYDLGVYQEYPLSQTGVMRIEAEHFDRNSIGDYEFIDFNGRKGHEHGTPGKGCGSVGMGRLWNQNRGAIVYYNNIKFAEEPEESRPISMKIKETNEAQAYVQKDAKVQAIVEEVDRSLWSLSYASADPKVAVVDFQGMITGVSYGETVITGFTDKEQAEVTIYVADKEYAKSLIEAYDVYLADKEEEYTTQSWKTLTDAYQAMKNVIDSEDAKEIYNAIKALKEAIDTRVKAANTNAINTYISIAETLEEIDYSEGWDALQKALSAAKEVTKDSLQEDVNKKAADLQTALYGLKEKEVTTIDKEELKKLIEEAEAVEQEGQKNYTQESWTAFTEALEKAQEIAEKEEPSKTEVRVATESLRAAKDNLKEDEYYLQLKLLYDQYKNVKGDAYTEESYTALKEALRKAEEVLSKTSTKEEVEETIAMLQKAADALEIKKEINKEPLETKIKEAKAIAKGNYTEGSYAALQTAIKQAEEVLEKASTQEEIEQAIAALQKAMNDLTLNNNTPIFNGGSSNTNNGTVNTTPSTDNDQEINNPPVDDNKDPVKNPEENTTEVKPDGTKVETKKETLEDGTIKETIVETKVNGTITTTVKNTKSDGSITETKEMKPADNSAILQINISDDLCTTIIRTGICSSSNTTAVPEELLEAIAIDDKLDHVIIEITKTTLQSASSGNKNTNVNLFIPSQEGVRIEKIVLTKDSIDIAKETKKGLKINLNVNDTKIAGNYTVTIPVKQLKKVDDSVKEVNITITADQVETVADDSIKNNVIKVLDKNKGKKQKTCVVSVASNENMNAGMKVTVPVTEKTAISKGSNVYIYRYDAKTGKLIETANCKQTVSQDGSVSIAALSGIDYVVSAKKLQGTWVETIADNIFVSVSKKTTKRKKTCKIKVVLPDTVSTKAAFGKEKAAITYRSNKNKIASVSKTGVILGKKKGTAVITTTVKLASGQKVVKKQKITVK